MLIKNIAGITPRETCQQNKTSLQCSLSNYGTLQMHELLKGACAQSKVTFSCYFLATGAKHRAFDNCFQHLFEPHAKLN